MIKIKLKCFKGITRYYNKMSRHYENAKIYKLVSNKTADVYIGSCLIKLHRRLAGHKTQSNTCSSKKMFEHDAIITIALLEAMPDCKSKAELKARELFYITTMDCINKNKPFITETEGKRDDDAEWAKEYKKEYYKNNTEEIKQSVKAYYIEHTDEIKAYYIEYNKNNAEEIKEQKKEYNKAHAEEIKARQKEYNKEHIEKKKA